MANCWEFKNCGREKGGAKEKEMGVCPSYTRNAGEACWLVAGTFCGGEVQGDVAAKEGNCMRCDFYKSFSLAHRSKMREKFQPRLS